MNLAHANRGTRGGNTKLTVWTLKSLKSSGERRVAASLSPLITWALKCYCLWVPEALRTYANNKSILWSFVQDLISLFALGLARRQFANLFPRCKWCLPSREVWEGMCRQDMKGQKDKRPFSWPYFRIKLFVKLTSRNVSVSLAGLNPFEAFASKKTPSS